MNILLGYHRHLVEIMVFIFLLNMLLPFILRNFVEKSIFWTRVGYFAFWGLWSMVAFSGLIVWLFARHPMNLSIISMLALLVLLPILDIYRAIKLKRLWLLEQNGLSFNTIVVGVELILTIAVILLAIFGH